MTDVTDRLSSLIEAEREALLAGDLQRVEGLLDEKTALAEELSALSPPPDELKPLRRALQRNQELFDRALEGIRNVVNRLGDMQQVRKSLETYDSQGKRASVPGREQRRLEKRA